MRHCYRLNRFALKRRMRSTLSKLNWWRFRQHSGAWRCAWAGLAPEQGGLCTPKPRPLGDHAQRAFLVLLHAASCHSSRAAGNVLRGFLTLLGSTAPRVQLKHSMHGVHRDVASATFP